MVDKHRMLELRDAYIAAIRSELLGPGSEISVPDEKHEILSDSPVNRYALGILYPWNTKRNADNDETNGEITASPDEDQSESIPEEAAGEAANRTGRGDIPAVESLTEDDGLDEDVGLASQNMPSSLGISFFATGDTSKVRCHLSFGTYCRIPAEMCRYPLRPDNPESYVLPAGVDTYVTFDPEEMCIKLRHPGIDLTRKTVRNQIEPLETLESDTCGLVNILYKLADQKAKGYIRKPHDVEVELCFGEGEYIDQNKMIDKTGLKVTAVRMDMGNGLSAITVMLVNDREAKGRPNVEDCIFQAEVRITTDDNAFVFSEYDPGQTGHPTADASDDEEKSIELQYKNKKTYVTGLGTSAYAEVGSDGKGYICSDCFPEAEVPGQDFHIPSEYRVPQRVFSMKRLSDLCDESKGKIIGDMRLVVDAYGKWIGGLNSGIPMLKAKYREAASKNVRGCNKARLRMEQGLSVLESDENVWNAFRLANRAMFMQRVHLQMQSDISKTGEIYPDNETVSEKLEGMDYYETHDSHFWRPFQLAFLLMSIPGIVNDNSQDRTEVDLIWFPTGGGKTEAYLGLTAFAIMYRRLAHLSESDGTVVIMRYTLRLLTAQQFTRASTLICACEYIRRECGNRKSIYPSYALGKQPVTIGLWIGNTHIPNRLAKAFEDLKKLEKACSGAYRFGYENLNKFQVLKCPWCGTKLTRDPDGKSWKGAFGYRKNGAHFELHCTHPSCEFGDLLPVQIIDEELYNNPPSLLFGTVDKFAMMPWNNKIASFFGLNPGSCARSPELIIQDELHLISGPLGTMVGLYESVIDALCRKKGVPAKIIASTATIRRAKEQCSALYDREVNQFPHPGLDAEDSFFSREQTIDYSRNAYGRKYVGLMPAGKTGTTMSIRTIAALMQTIRQSEMSDEEKDLFWTLTVYFNSLRELGKCSTLVDDDIKDAIRRMASRFSTVGNARSIFQADELTSRVSTSELNRTLDKLEKAHYSSGQKTGNRASDILLASNMISVGIDIARLNVMAVVGQPKLTSEYIQASSRVGREFPGVVFTMYNAAKSRDRSHYEQFKPYHESFYRFVEPTVATPFSKPARQRALHALLVAWLRLTEPALAKDKDAYRFSRSDFEDAVSSFRSFVIARSDRIAKGLNMDSSAEEICEEFDFIVSHWEELKGNFDSDHFFYGEKFMLKPPEKGVEGRLLREFSESSDDFSFPTMTSMRNVDTSISGEVLIWEEDLK